MLRKTMVAFTLACAFLVAGCHHKVENPMAGIDSKQPDKTLYNRAMDSMKKGRYQEARTLLETLINAYPESEYIARAKLAVGDSWGAEGGAAWKQAELQYKDFQTFFPNMPESAEAQLKVATIHYRQMEKPDRDFTEATRASDEYKDLIRQYPESALVPEAKQRLREVQEILAERQYRIANFYLRNNLPAAQARLQSLVESYPLYSGIDKALYELGSLYEKQVAAVKRQQNISEAVRKKLVDHFQKGAIDAYQRIITRYPGMHLTGNAIKRLHALNATVPSPTPEAMADSKAEEQSRVSISMTTRVLGTFKKHLNVARASGTGEPNLTKEAIIAPGLRVQDLSKQITTSNQEISPVAVREGSPTAPGVNQSLPGPSSSVPPPTEESATSSPDNAPPTPAPAQVNELQKDTGGDTQAQGGAQGVESGQASSTDSKQDSSSKKESKKGIHKVVSLLRELGERQ